MKFTITLDEQELQLVISALAELPFKIVADLVAKLVAEAKQQATPPDDPPPA